MYVFFQFIKKFFVYLIHLKGSNFKGFKLNVAGNLKGKRRSSKKYITYGQFPLQSFNKNIEFAKLHAFTIYGVFGLKFWVYRSK
jgi:ribosomal protein S3